VGQGQDAGMAGCEPGPMGEAELNLIQAMPVLTLFQYAR
jgi:hypothetical protein